MKHSKVVHQNNSISLTQKHKFCNKKFVFCEKRAKNLIIQKLLCGFWIANSKTCKAY